MIIAREGTDKIKFMLKPNKGQVLLTALLLVFTSPLYMAFSGFYPEPFMFQEGIGFPLPFIGSEDPFNPLSAIIDLGFWYLVSTIVYNRWFV